MTGRHRAARPLRRMAMGTGVALSTFALMATSVTASGASWIEEEWVHGSLGTTAYRCGVDQNYAVQSLGQFLGGDLLGIDLDDIAELEGVHAERFSSDLPSYSPSGTTHVPDDETRDAFLNPLAVEALGAIGIDLSGLTVGLPVGSAGAVNQFAEVTSFGYSAAASGLVTNNGGLGITPTTPSGEIPEAARIQLSTLLPVVAGVTDVGLRVGAVGAVSALDWCAVSESLIWGDGSATSERDYGIAGLGLAVDSPLVAGLIPRVQGAIAELNAVLIALQGTNGLLAQALIGTLTGVGGVLAQLNLGAVTGSVTLTGLDLGPVNGLLAGTGAVLSDEVVTLDLADPDGTILIDLAELLGGPDQLNNLSPNTELLINAPVIDDILSRVGVLVQGWVDDVTDALLAAIQNIRLVVDLRVTAGVTVPIFGAVDILTVDIDLDASLGSLLDPEETAPEVTVSASVLPGVTGLILTAVNTLLGTLLGLNLPGLVNGINANAALPGDLLAAIIATLTGSLLSIVDSLVTDLTDTAVQLVTALASVLNPLPTILSVMVNVRPDQPGAPPGASAHPGAAPFLSPEYRVTALRIGLLDEVVGAPVFVNLATASVGPQLRLP